MAQGSTGDNARVAHNNIRRAALHIILALTILVGIALPTSAAEPDPIHVLFVNGIQNTPEQALVNMLRLRNELLNTDTRAPDQRRPFIVAEHVYNPAGWTGNADTGGAIEDFLELFLLKTAEECYRSDFERFSVPHNQSKPVNVEAAERVRAYLDNMVPGSDASVPCGTTFYSSSPAAAEAMESARQTAQLIQERVRRFESTIVVAHSQGNLLAHLAYAGLAAEMGDEISSRLRIVNVANTASVSANGLTVSHEDDEALSLLRDLPPWLGVAFRSPATFYRDTPVCSSGNLCDFAVERATLQNAEGFGDDKKHGFVDTYLSNFSVQVADSRGVPFTLGKEAFVDRLVDVVYAAAESLRPWASIEPPAIAADGQPASVRSVLGATVVFAVQASGSNPLRYQWRRNGIDVPCSSPTVCNRLDWTVTAGDDGARFDVVVSNARGSVTSNTATIALEPPAPPPVVGVPDLLPLGIASDAVGVEPGQTVSISVTVENRGLGSAQASSMLLQLSTDRDSPGTAAPWAEVSIPPLSSGQSVRVAANGVAPILPGSYYLWATVDSGRTSGQTADTRLNDSARMADPLVVRTTSPSGEVDLLPAINVILPPRVAMGGMITLGFTVANAGRTASLPTSATVRLMPSSAPESIGPILATVPVQSIAAGSSGLFTASFKAPFDPGIYRARVEVDSADVAGQGEGDRANDVVLSAAEVTVLTTGYPDGTPWEGAYEGSIAGGTFPAFRLYVLDSGEYWAFYGYIASAGNMNGGFFAQGQVSFGGSAFSSSDSRDFGFFPSRAASVSGELNPTTREFSASSNVAGASTTWTGLSLSRVIYDYAVPASLESIAGAWGIQFNTGDRAVITVDAGGAFQSVSVAGCSMSGRLTPAPNGRNFFRLTVTFGGAPCLLAGQTTSGIAVRHTLSNGTPGIEFAVMTADRRGGAAGWGSR